MRNEAPMLDGSIEDELIQAVSGSNLMTFTREIAKWVRLSGEPDELESFKWVQAKLEEFGYRTKLLHHEGYISLPGEARLEVAGQSSPIECITHAFNVSTPAEGVSGQLVYVNVDEAASRVDDIQGNIVLVDGMASGVSVRRLEALGAKGQVYIHDDYLHESTVSPVWGNPTDRTIGGMPKTPGIAIRRADGAKLKQLLHERAVHVTLHATVDNGWRHIPLLVADLKETASEPFVLFSSHIDSWYYGAMDNGSANATALEVARLMSENKDRLRRGLRLAFWSGHSHGRFCGSAWYADAYYDELAERCVGHVYVDSTGGQGATIVTEPPVMPATHDFAADVLHKVTGEKLVGKRIGRFADQSFYGIGLPALFGTFSEQDAELTKDGISFKTGGSRAGGLGWWWHTPHDTVDKVDEANLVRDTRVYTVAIYRLLTEPLLPYNFTPAVREIRETVRELAANVQGRFDFARLVEQLGELETAVESFGDRVKRINAGDDGEVCRANAAIMQLAGHLVSVGFQENGRFDHDPSDPLQPVPSLQLAGRLGAAEADSDEFYLLLTRLRRQHNWVFQEVVAAQRVVERFLAK